MENKHNHGSRQQMWTPSTPQEDLHPARIWQIASMYPPEQAGMFFLGMRGSMALKTLLYYSNDALP
jgi:hypothetical protein